MYLRANDNGRNAFLGESSMKDILNSLIGVLLFSIMIIYIIFKGGGSRVDPEKLEKIREDIQKKPIGDIVTDINEWLS